MFSVYLRICFPFALVDENLHFCFFYRKVKISSVTPIFGIGKIWIFEWRGRERKRKYKMGIRKNSGERSCSWGCCCCCCVGEAGRHWEENGVIWLNSALSYFSLGRTFLNVYTPHRFHAQGRRKSSSLWKVLNLDGSRKWNGKENVNELSPWNWFSTGSEMFINTRNSSLFLEF